jgi:hypothetical protein
MQARQGMRWDPHFEREPHAVGTELFLHPVSQYCTVPVGICSAYPIIILSTLSLSERDIPRMADCQNCWKRAIHCQFDNYVGGGLFYRMDAADGIPFSCSESHFPLTEHVLTLDVRYRTEPCQDGLWLAWF